MDVMVASKRAARSHERLILRRTTHGQLLSALKTHSRRRRSTARSRRVDKMGKARRKKTHGGAARAAVDSGTAVSAKETQPLFNTSINGSTTGNMDMQAGVLDGLTSLKALTRESSCAAIASLFEKIDSPEAGSGAWAAAQRLIAGGLVKKLLPRLVDRAPDVKLQATGAVRNISAVRDPRVCEIMVQDDCLTPVLTLLDRMSNPAAIVSAADENSVISYLEDSKRPNGDGPSAASGQDGAAEELERMVMAQLVATLCNLLAAVDVAVGRFTRQGGLQVIMRLLQAEGCHGSAEVFGGALQALHVATDGNADLVGQLMAMPGAVQRLSSLVTGATVNYVQVSTSMRLQSAGIIVNVAGSSAEARTTASQLELSRLVLPLLLEQMTYDPTTLDRVCAALPSNTSTVSGASKGAGEQMEVDGDAAATAEGGSDVTTDLAAGAAAALAAATPMQITTGGEGNATNTEQNAPGSDKGTAGENEREGVGNENGKEATEEDGTKSPAEPQPDKDAELRWAWKTGVAEPLKLAAEVLTNLCALAATDEEGFENEGEEEEWGSDDEDAMERAATAGGGVDGEECTRNTDNQLKSCTVLLDALTDGGTMQRTITALRALLSPTPRDRFAQNAQAAGEGKRLALPFGTAADLADLRATVALCSANLVQNLPIRALGMDPNLLWLDLCGMCEAAAERAPSCIETLTGVMWGLVRRAGQAIADGVRVNGEAQNPTTGEMGSAEEVGVKNISPLLLRLCDPEATRSFEARVNAIGMLGALGAAVAAGNDAAGVVDHTVERVNRYVELGRALVQAMEDPHVLVQAEALNAVMDVFGDDEQDAAFRACGAPAALAAGVPAFRRKVKQEGKAVGRDALCHLKETALNAARFVKYKQASIGSGVR